MATRRPDGYCPRYTRTVQQLCTRIRPSQTPANAAADGAAVLNGGWVTAGQSGDGVNRPLGSCIVQWRPVGQSGYVVDWSDGLALGSSAGSLGVVGSTDSLGCVDGAGAGAVVL